MLRRRRDAEEETAREAEGGQEANEGGRQRRDSARCVPRHSPGWREVNPTLAAGVPDVAAALPPERLHPRLVPAARNEPPRVRQSARSRYPVRLHPTRTTFPLPMNFALILFLLTAVTGAAWLVDKLVLEGRRRERARAAIANFDRQRAAVPATESAAAVAQREQVETAALREPSWVEYSKAFFPVLLIVFLLRSFLAEPFKIPSSSMRPTLEVGDFILVNKFIYGIRLPILEKKIIPIGDPRRGDVVVFRYPVNPTQDFIKRVIGVAGDVVEYRDKRLTVNGEPWPQRADGSYSYLEGLR